MKTAAKMILVDLPVRSRSEASDGVSDGRRWSYTLRCQVEMSDGTVRVWDDVAGYYTTCHSLTPEQVATARRMAGLPAE